VVAKGESPMNGMIASKVLDYFQQTQQSNSTLYQSNLTEREKEILLLLMKGLSIMYPVRRTGSVYN
jgi:DNA-binding NarL/FixJ family response regulator